MPLFLHPAVSVNIAIFNTRPFLAESINSILAQSFQDFELIIVDDGSTDGSLKVLREFAEQDARIKLFEQSNQGVAIARNLALRHSKGRYIAVMDSDDIALPDRLQIQKDYLDTHPDIDAIGSQWLMLDKDGNRIGIDYHATDPLTINALMYNHYALHHPTTMIRRNAMEAIGGYNEEHGRLCVDYDLFMRMQCNGSLFANLPKVLFAWRLIPSSITHSKAHRQTEYVIQTRDEGFAELLKRDPSQAHAIARQLMRAYPTGTWLDDKIKRLFPDREESLLYRTWLELPAESTAEQFDRALVFWLRYPEQHGELLQHELIEHNMPWLASLTGAYHAKVKVLPLPQLQLPQVTSIPTIALSLFIPFADDIEDFLQRIEQAIALKSQVESSMELILFSAGKNPLNRELIAHYLEQPNCVFIGELNAWENALYLAKGLYFAYLEENFRFETDPFITVLCKTQNESRSIVYMTDDRYFREAVDETGNPLLDNSHAPKWNQSTLLGKHRVNLSGFIHNRMLLNGLNGNLKETGAVAAHMMAKHLIINHPISMETGAVKHLVPGINLNIQPIDTFRIKILNWYYDFGMTALPSSDSWPNLSKARINQLAGNLSEAWLNHRMVIHRGNSKDLKRFYLDHTVFPLRWALFRHLQLQNKLSSLSYFWHKRAIINLLVSLLYFAYKFLNHHKKMSLPL